MGLLKIFSKPETPISRLPSGCFTVDRAGRILIGTVPSNFPSALVRDIGRHVLDTFREAQAAQLPLSELVVHFGAFKITARELRGGAMIFLAPSNHAGPVNRYSNSL